MSRQKKQFAVIGLGRFGTSVAMTLQQLGHEVLAIDADEERVQKISDQVTHVVQADTTDENSLQALGLRNFDAVVVAIGENVQANVATTLLVKDMGVPLSSPKRAMHCMARCWKKSVRTGSFTRSAIWGNVWRTV